MEANNRREFFKKVFFYTSAGAIVHVLARGHRAQAAELKLIDMTGKKRTDEDNKKCVGVAGGLNYVDDLGKALKDKKITKEDKPGANNKIWKTTEQNCSTCAFYTVEGKGTGKCTLIPGCLVAEKGSCNTWAPKA